MNQKEINWAPNELEKLLLAAIKYPNRRADFYEAFYDSEVYILQMEGNDAAGGGFASGDEIGVYMVEGSGGQSVAIFSSPMFMQMHVTKEERCLQVKVRDLIELTGGEQMVLNARTKIETPFTREAVAGLNDGSLVQRLREKM
ncbi:enhanced serine sensitivity protein SseB [Poriferisphaera corsica]|uniref:Enhanced serine sensitivity protein SseB n=1 Tax=Poriferisphaera corsica TaxID=2528020 RepID=A0A517YY87_9BACT|nr:SseB family protein [Poriferisphaera corsica]QDU35175.1 enhanced serine sensitivity protein SseB [Poriferisphaera corsica]